MMKKALTVILLSALTILLALPYASTVKASDDNFISFDSGITVYSPLNKTYYNTNPVLNVSLYGAGNLGSLDSSISLRYSIDGIYNGIVPLRSNGEFHVVTTAIGFTDLPSIPEGHHILTFDYYGLNQRDSSPKYLAYEDTLYFSTVGQSVTQNPTPDPTTSPSLTPTNTPIVPELTLLDVLPLMLSILFATVLLRHKKTLK